MSYIRHGYLLGLCLFITTFLGCTIVDVDNRVQLSSGEIFVLDIARNNVNRFAQKNVFYRFPIWSSDGSKLAYRADNNIHYVDVQSGFSEELVKSEFSTFFSVNYDWSPDGKELAYLEENDNADLTLNIINIETKQVIKSIFIGGNLFYSAIDWSPRGDYVIIYSGNKDARLVDLRNETVEVIEGIGGSISIAWCPNGEAFAYSTVAPQELLKYDTSLYNVGTKERLEITDLDASQISWSEDGTTMAFVSRLDNIYHLYTLEIGAGPVEVFTRNDKIRLLGWSSDDSELLFINPDSKRLSSITLETGEIKNLSRRSFQESNWIRLSPDKTRLVFGIQIFS